MGREIRRIAVLTSGGDAPGMNAAIRAIVRAGLDLDCETFGVKNGYTGLMSGKFVPLGARDVGGIIQQGGTILGSTRCEEFRTAAGRRRALTRLEQHAIEGLIVIGGNGSQAGAHALNAMGFPVVGVASTIDNDLAGSDITIGVDTALNVALEAIDRLKTTASSHRRAFVVEVMGRDCGYLALMARHRRRGRSHRHPRGRDQPEALADDVRCAYRRGKAHAIIVVSEHAVVQRRHPGTVLRDASRCAGFDLRVTKLGHVQRGGAPGAADRLLATRLGAAAVRALARGEHGMLAGYVKGAVAITPLADVVSARKLLDPDLLQLAPVLAA